MSTHHPIYSSLYDVLMAGAEKGGLAERRRRLLEKARGRVLEIGGGTGVNLTYYPQGAVTELHVVEPDAAMRKRLERRVAGATLPVHVHNAPAEALPFPDAHFDTIISTLVLCSVDDLGRALAELRRVLRPDGRLFFIEHVRKEAERGRWQDRLNGVWSFMMGGCHLNRDTVHAIEQAGFRVGGVESFPVQGMAPIVTPFLQGEASPA